MEDTNINEEKLNTNTAEEMTNENTENIQQDNLAEAPSAEQQLADEKDKYIRLYAEFDNYRKRTSKEKMEYFRFANQDMMISMLGVLDDFERAIKEISKNGNEADIQGVELIYQKFKSKLFEKGLKVMEVKAGDDFNVDLHEAITQVPAPSDDLKGKIVDVIETGYTLSEKVIRFAKVVTGN